MKVESVLISKDLEKGKDNLLTLKGVYFAIEAQHIPFKIPFCLFIAFRFENREIGSTLPLVIRLFTPNKESSITLNSSPLQINNELASLFLKGEVTFIQTGKHIIQITANDNIIYEESIVNIVLLPITSSSSTTTSSSSTSSSSFISTTTSSSSSLSSSSSTS